MIVSIFIYFGVIALTLFLMKVVPIWYSAENRPIGWRIKTMLSIFVVSYPLIVLLGSRVDIGTDYANYEKFYDYYQSTGVTAFEPLFYGLFWIGDAFQWGFDSFIVITSILCVAIPLGFIKIRFPKDDVLVATFTLIVLLFGSWFNIIRQCVAMGILLISMHYLIERKVLPFILFVLLASLCHVSSLVFLPIALIVRIINKSETQRQLIRNLLFLGFINLTLIYVYLNFGADLAYYEHVGGEEEDGITSKWYIIFSILLYIPEFLNMKKMLDYDKRYSVLYVLVVLEFSCYLFGLYMNLGYRIGQLFSLVHVYLLPATINCAKMNGKTIVKPYVLSVLFVFFYFTSFIAKYNGMYSYKYSTSTFYELVPFLE